MLCPKCGTENQEQAEVCINCDEKLTQSQEDNGAEGVSLRVKRLRELRQWAMSVSRLICTVRESTVKMAILKVTVL